MCITCTRVIYDTNVLKSQSSMITKQNLNDKAGQFHYFLVLHLTIEGILNSIKDPSNRNTRGRALSRERQFLKP